MSRRKELWMKRTIKWLTHLPDHTRDATLWRVWSGRWVSHLIVKCSLTSKLHEKLLTATNEIISLVSSKKCSNAISTFDELQTQTPYLSKKAKKKKKNAHSLLFFLCAVPVQNPSTKKNVTSWNAKKTRALSFFFLISVRCAVWKDPPKRVTYVERTCYPFFPSYQYVVQFEKTRQKEWRSARASLFFPSYDLKVKMEGFIIEHS